MKKFFGFVKNLFLNERLNDIVVYAYTVAVILYQLLYQIIPVRVVIHSLGLDVVSSLLAVIGLGLFLWDLLTRRIFLKTKLSYVLIALIVVMGISALIRVEYGIVNNIKAIIWQVAQMLVIFPMFLRLTKAKMFDLLKVLFISFSAFALPAIFVSFFQYYTRTHYLVSVGGGTLNQGFSQGRLYGVFGSMHFTTLILVSMAMLAILFGIKKNKKIIKISYFIVAALYLVYSAATGTRSIIIGILCSTVLVCYFVVKKLIGNVKINRCLGVFLSAGVSILATGIVLLCFVVTTKALTASNVAVYNVILKDQISTAPNEQDSDKRPSSLPDAEVERTDVDISNISNNRFTIWEEYLDIVFDKPISAVFGLSLGEYQKIITTEYSDKYIVQYIMNSHPSMFERGYIYDTHNAYVGALIMTGIAGILTLFVFLIMGLMQILKVLSKKQSTELLVLFAILVFILITSFFDSDLFFRCTSTSVLFWLISGFALKYCQEQQ